MTGDVILGPKEWVGTFLYSFNNRACKWQYADASDWEINKVKGSELCELASAIRNKWNDLKDTLKKKNIKLPDAPRQGFLDFFSNNKSPSHGPTVVHGISVMLNNVVFSQSVKDFIILANFVDKHVTVQMMGLPYGHPCWFYVQLKDSLEIIEEDLLCFPEEFFEMNNGKILRIKRAEELERIIELRRYCRIIHRYTVLKYLYNESEIKISLKDQVRIVPYKKGRVCMCIPIPGKPKQGKLGEDYLVPTPEVVITSPNVVKTLESLTKIWEDRFARSVLISAPPGSGKEILANSIPFGNGRPTNNFLTISMATADIESIAKQLFGAYRDSGLIEEGLIAKAKGSALFLDEVHYPEDNPIIRASLLRPLETGEYYPIGSNKPEKVQDVLFILATSKPLTGATQGRSLSEIPPKDFWTRMTYVLQVKHPLDYDEDENVNFPKEQVIQYFYRFFWWENVEKFCGIYPMAQESAGKGQPFEQLIRQQALKLLDEEALRDTSQKFSEILLQKMGGMSLQHFSIRGIRSMVSRMFSIAVSNIRRGYDLWREREFEEQLKIVINEIFEVAKL
ncbi:MAG: hypothetical protein B5M53_11410 [Candidatus Cloacimonas sp. 4484_209]|nr:MAG: hypothetical protein B5M53_11410 [Candidatus Cloacimonas sp. 4484_209]